MSQPGKKKQEGRRRDLDGFFVAGGPVQPGRGCYVRRAADRELGRLVRAGEYVQVMAPRHMGKSSLMARLAEELRGEGRHVAVVDLTQVGARERPDDLGRWFYSFAFRLIRQLRLKVDLQEWWQDKAVLTNRQRLTELYWDLILESTSGPVTIFIDEMQCLDNFAGVEQLLASIRAAHNARAAEPALARLNFVMLGVSVPEGFDADSEYSPFAVAQPVVLRDFRLHQLDVFAPALGLAAPRAKEAVERIHFWTNGQPYLTQKLARAVARARMREADLEDPAFVVDALAYRLYLNPSALRNEPHLSYLHHALTEPRKEHDEILAVYGRVRKGGKVILDPESPAQRRLISRGLLMPTRGGTLAVRNRLYHQVFTARWANEQLPFRWRRISAVAAAVLLTILVPIWYTQYLPRPWTSVLTAADASLPEARDAWETLSRLPGHGASADRMFLDYLSRMSRGAADVAAVEAADELLRTLPGAEPLADQLVAEFWDRRALAAELRHERDAALLARIRSLAEPTVERRRRAAALVGEDYALLAATLRVPRGFDQAVLARDGRRLVAARGNTVHVWAIDRLPPVAEPAWDATALRFLPAVSRRQVQAEGRAGTDLVLEARIDHDRPFDLSITLTAPSGRSVSFQPGLAAAAPMRHRFTARGGVLTPLADEPRGGTWTLSVADRVPGVTGTLAGWSLDFGDVRADASPAPPPLALEDPVAETESLLFLGPAGRYAIAVPPAGDAAARVWDLASRSPVSTLPVTREDRIIGFVLDQRVVLVHGPAGIEAWTLSTGDPVELPGVGREAVLSALSPDGDVLALVGTGPERAVEGFDLIEGRELGATAAGVDHSAIAIAPGGRLVAVADPDRAVRVWRFGDEQPFAELDPPGVPVALRFGGRGERLAVQLADGGLMLWRAGKDGAAGIRHYPAPGPWEVSFDETGDRLLVGAGASGFRLLGEALQPVRGPLLRGGFAPGQPVWAAHRDADRLALTGSPGDGWMRVWRLQPARPAAEGRQEEVTAVALSPDGRTTALGTRDGSLRLRFDGEDASVSAAPAEERVNYFGHTRAVCCAAFSPDGSVLATAAVDGSLRVWDARAGEPREFIALQPAAHPVDALAVSGDGERVAVIAGPHLQIWDASEGRLLSQRQPGAPVTAVQSLPGGEGFVLGDESGSLWQLGQADRLERLAGVGGAVTALALTRDGSVLAVATAGGALQLLDREDRQLKGAADPLPVPAAALAFSGDGDHLVARSGHWLHRYRLSVFQLLPESSRLLPAAVIRGGMSLTGADGERVRVLAGHGTPRPVSLSLSAADVPPLQGESQLLVEQWRDRLRPGTAVVSDPAPAARGQPAPVPAR
jgi:WD40 repeat protein